MMTKKMPLIEQTQRLYLIIGELQINATVKYSDAAWRKVKFISCPSKLDCKSQPKNNDSVLFSAR